MKSPSASAAPPLSPSQQAAPLLAVSHIAKRVQGPEGELTLLEDIDFTLSAAESLAITGPSGSGKTTLLGLLAGLDTPSQGEIRLNGQSFSTLNEDQRASSRGAICAFVFQEFHLVADMTALENVMLPLELAGRDKPAAIAKDWLERVGLSHRTRHFPATLSGGEQQRVALARAFAVQPRLLFADEPTGSLDHANGKRVIELLFELNQHSGAALVLVTHDPQLASRCQHHIELVEGQIFSNSMAALSSTTSLTPPEQSSIEKFVHDDLLNEDKAP
ncbi:MAG: ATP-binding cassette domain-containing protein [Gammaproteobacteria bacterium]|nr:ATP-binding cassette domain-containing protein [Gammaproteobacteria bacterium]MBQ0840349.1 ATP-binding cassette domain-containing protein [Gammaproteobacteria bacterium]